jgi:cellulose synthase/poly-beta-1,6-N-acetylglucosamine synthase-like glycosyltransferase
MMIVLLTLAAWLNLAFWIVRAGTLCLGLKYVAKLKEEPPAEASAESPLPKLAVIVAALNEESGIEAALRSLAAQDYPDLLIFAVNDRSTDRTGEIMEAVAQILPAVHPVHIRELPPNWIGKNHANWIGAKQAMQAGAEWLLFTDGDVLFSPFALRQAVHYVQRKRLDHLAVTPGFILGGFWENAFLTAFLVWFLTRFQTWRIEDEKSRQFLGVGAFNAVRAEAYRAVGTHEALALTVADDVGLGKLIKTAGFRQGLLDGSEEVRVRWQNGLWEAVRGLYKNSFASLDFNLPFTLFSAAMMLILNVLSYLLPFVTLGFTRGAAILALAVMFEVYTQSARSMGVRPSSALGIGLCAGFGGALFAWAMVASAVITLRQGGVVWRGTLYPISLLKGRQVKL